MSNKTEQIEINATPSTPSSHWRAEGVPDPHAGHYDGERAALTMGNLTDDELANGAFMNYDQPLNVHGIIAGTHSSPIAWMTAAKDRIRWLSRSLEKAADERDALADELKALREIDRDKVRDAIADALGDMIYCCTRQWSAWAYGTMSQNDFVLASEDDGILDELTEAAISALSGRLKRPEE